MKDSTIDYFKGQLKVYHSQTSRVGEATNINKAAQLASYKVAHRIAQCKKPHTIAEELILPAAIDMITCLLGEDEAKELKSIPLSDPTISRRVSDISKDLKDQLSEKLKDKPFSLQVDEATDSNQDCLLIAYYVRYVDGDSMVEDMLFCHYIHGRTTAKELFKVMDSFLMEANY